MSHTCALLIPPPRTCHLFLLPQVLVWWSHGLLTFFGSKWGVQSKFARTIFFFEEVSSVYMMLPLRSRHYCFFKGFSQLKLLRKCSLKQVRMGILRHRCSTQSRDCLDKKKWSCKPTLNTPFTPKKGKKTMRQPYGHLWQRKDDVGVCVGWGVGVHVCDIQPPPFDFSSIYPSLIS